MARPEAAGAAAVRGPAEQVPPQGTGPAPADGDVHPAAHPAEPAAEHPAAHPAEPPADPSSLADAELVDLVRGGRDSAYEELYRRHADAVRRYARSCCRDAHTAEDLTGEVFARTLQAIRGGSGPQSAVRAYLLTTVRRVAATWSTSTKREQLVEDFAVFAVSATGSSAPGGTEEVGADVRAMHAAERSLAIKAFRTLPERWQTVLWHTAVEDESPSAVAPLLGLTPNATAVLAHRAREGLRQAYLQAHVSSSLTAEGECARYADRLGAHARGGLRLRADRELNRHLKECERCSAASLELADLNSALKGLLPVAYIGWFAAAYAAKAAGIVAGGAAAAGAAGGAAAAATGSGSSAGAAGGGAAAGEGLGAPAKAGLVAGIVVAAAATALAFALTGGEAKPKPAPPRAGPPASAPVATLPAAPAPPARPKPSPSLTPPPVLPAAAAPAPRPSPSPTPTRQPKPAPPAGPAPSPAPHPTPTPTPPPTTPPPTTPPPASPPPPAPTAYKVNSLPVALAGSGATAPTIRPGLGSWWWDRWGLSIGGTTFAHGITVHAPSTVTIDLNRACVSYDARAGVDDLVRRVRSTVDFSVYGDGSPLWRSGPVRAGDPAVPVHVGLKGYRTLRLVVRPVGRGFGEANLADWADSVITCG
ncbi:sigma-70 family RNA polymerase sigma factor [Streptomyces sp. V4-01]|uniref:Sigma-70 family RNA polymerase sigma factor n=1 Tax=Actinacidiphila polyblastidii TaxID=3110430 RepID=A0ABU7PN78_9ACTN|nr:sigma-70 family RNA polymerase sigma factor [Streptomyces sp. V4-01]